MTTVIYYIQSCPIRLFSRYSCIKLTAMRKHFKITTLYKILLVLVVILSSCKRDTISNPLPEKVKEKFSDTFDDIKKIDYDSLKKSLSSGKDATTEQVQKFSTIEYKFLEFDRSTTAADLEVTLSTLGKERWDCTQNNIKDGVIGFTCKRYPVNYLKMLGLLGGLVGG